MPPAVIEIRVLGPVEVVRDGALVQVGGDKQRRALALLALAGGRVVAADELAEELWGADAAPNANALQAAVSRLRRRLGAADAIELAGPGYRFRGRVDADEFEALARRGSQALAAGDAAAASVLLRDALGLWRGSALAGLDLGPGTSAAAARLEEARLQAWERRNDADLALGEDAALVSELEELVARHPLRERLRWQLMLALYRSGRQADALAAYREGRRISVEELGLEPGPQLQRLEQEILRQDPALERPTPPPRGIHSTRRQGPPLLEREQELACIDEAVAAVAHGRGRLLAIEGVGGIGKTTLLTEAAQRGAAAGMRVLSGRGRELERDLAFGVVRQLFEVPLGRLPDSERRALLSGAAARTEPLFGFADPASDIGWLRPGADTAALLHGLYWLVAGMSERSSLILAVDDAHWADEASLRFLGYLAERLEDLPVLLVVAARPAGGQEGASAMEAVHAAAADQVLRPGELGERSVAEVVRQTLSRSADEPFCRACARASGGNPFLLRELLQEIVAEGPEPDADRVAQIERMVPEHLARAVFPRLVRGGAEAVRLARAVAVLGGSAELRHVARLAELDEAAAAATTDRLAASGVLRATRPLEFVHPILRSAVYEDMPTAARALAHGRAARLLAAEGERPEHVAVHLMAAEATGDPAVVALLRAAAARTRREGAPLEAARLLRRALAEPPESAVRPELLAELGACEWDAMQVEPAVEHLRAALEGPLAPRRRVEAAHALGLVLALLGRLPETVELYEDTIAEIDDSDPDARHWLELELQIAAAEEPRAQGRVRPRLARLRTELEGAGTLEELRLLAVLSGSAVQDNAPAAQVLGLAERALAGGRLLAAEGGASTAYGTAVSALLLCDRLDLADPHVHETFEDSRRRGTVYGMVAAWTRRAFYAEHRGDLLDAELSTRSAIGLLDEHGMSFGIRLYDAALACYLAARGERSAAAAVLDRLAGEPEGSMQSWFLLYRGQAKLLLGHGADAAADLLAAGSGLQQLGYTGPAGAPWRSQAALALTAQGERERARALAAEEVELARAFGAPRVLGSALRAAGLVEGGDNGVDLLREAVRVLTGSSARLEHARALVDLGAALRRAGHRVEAREPLAAGRELAHNCGAAELARHAGTELEATGARPRSILRSGVEALTPSELRVGMLAAEGLSNPEIAQTLFITRKTVESHLRSIYTKLGIRSRGGLPEALGPR